MSEAEAARVPLVPGFAVSTSDALTVSELGASATFSIVLTAPPTANVALGIASDDPSEATIAPDRIVFTADDWNIPKTVTVTGKTDCEDDGDVAFAVAWGTVETIDAVYASLAPPPIVGINRGTQTPASVLLSETTLLVSENGSTSTFSVTLACRPSAPVTVRLSSADPSEATVLPAALTFTADSFATAQTATVTGVADCENDGDVQSAIVTSRAVSDDPSYFDLDVADVGVTNVDTQGAGILVAPTGGVMSDESGGAATFSLSLTCRPIAPVGISFVIDAPDEGDVSPNAVVFGTDDWSIPRVVSVLGVDDDDADDAQPYTITVAPAASADPSYDGLDPPDVSGINQDDDVPGILVIPGVDSQTAEDAPGNTATFSLRLATRPTQTVTLPLTGGSEGVPTVASVSFDASDWSAPKGVTVVGVNDAIDDDTQAYTIAIGPAQSTDPKYQGRVAVSPTLTNLDEDLAGYTAVVPPRFVTRIDGYSMGFSMRLRSQPLADVSFTVSTSNASEGVVSPTGFLFTPSNWMTPQPATLTGVSGPTGSDVAYDVIFGAATSTDPRYQGVPAPIPTKNLHTDRKKLVLQPPPGSFPFSPTVADTQCPVGYKAMLSANPFRRACSSANCVTNGIHEGIDWVLYPDLLYVRSDGTTVISTTTAAAIFTFPLSGKLVDTPNTYWSGLTATWTPSPACGGSPNGTNGDASSLTSSFIQLGSPACASLNFLVCAEQ